LFVKALKNAIGVCLAVVALAAVGASPASAEVLRVEEKGAPLATGQLETHGVIHCRVVAELIEADTHGSSGSIVIRPGERWMLAAPKGGTCEEIYAFFTGE